MSKLIDPNKPEHVWFGIILSIAAVLILFSAIHSVKNPTPDAPRPTITEVLPKDADGNARVRTSDGKTRTIELDADGKPK